jgi:hypothetical protein
VKMAPDHGRSRRARDRRAVRGGAKLQRRRARGERGRPSDAPGRRRRASSIRWPARGSSTIAESRWRDRRSSARPAKEPPGGRRADCCYRRNGAVRRQRRRRLLLLFGGHRVDDPNGDEARASLTARPRKIEQASRLPLPDRRPGRADGKSRGWLPRPGRGRESGR